LHVDFRRPGIEAVLDQLLQHRGGPFHDFAGGDLADQKVGKGVDARHRAIIGAVGYTTRPMEILPQFIAQFLDIVLHLDKHLAILVVDYGVWIYAILFAIIFCETGLVVTPFLPGDSLRSWHAGGAAWTLAMDCRALSAAVIAQLQLLDRRWFGKGAASEREAALSIATPATRRMASRSTARRP
jgi:hypothetical protein